MSFVTTVDQFSSQLGLNEGQIITLENVFIENPRITNGSKEILARQIGTSNRVVQLWFQERRKLAKSKKLEESSRVEMILAQAGQKIVSESDLGAAKSPEIASPSTPPSSRCNNSIESGIRQSCMSVSGNQDGPVHSWQASIETPSTPVTGQSMNQSSTKYLSPSEASYASLERSVAAARAAYVHSPYAMHSNSVGGLYGTTTPPPVISSPSAPEHYGRSPYSPAESFSVRMAPSMLATYVNQFQSPVARSPGNHMLNSYSSPDSWDLQELNHPQSPIDLSLKLFASKPSIATRRRRQIPSPMRLRRTRSLRGTSSVPSTPSTAPLPQKHTFSPDPLRIQPVSSGVRRSKSVSIAPTYTSNVVTRDNDMYSRKLSFSSADPKALYSLSLSYGQLYSAFQSSQELRFKEATI
ncbi:hypothetical protein V1511DRAFT_131978 [Dipodascopsis uninucleata]